MGFGPENLPFSSKFVKVFLNDSCQIALFSLYTSLSGRIHILSKRYSPWEQTCWLPSTEYAMFCHSEPLFMDFEKPPPSGPKLDPDLALPRMYHLRINAINLGFPP